MVIHGCGSLTSLSMLPAFSSLHLPGGGIIRHEDSQQEMTAYRYPCRVFE